MSDHIIDEIRRIRDEHAQQFNYDIDAICDDYQREKVNSKRIYVKRTPNYLSAVLGTSEGHTRSRIKGKHDLAIGFLKPADESFIQGMQDIKEGNIMPVSGLWPERGI